MRFFSAAGNACRPRQSAIRLGPRKYAPELRHGGAALRAMRVRTVTGSVRFAAEDFTVTTAGQGKIAVAWRRVSVRA
jgi:hypothetical protein